MTPNDRLDLPIAASLRHTASARVKRESAQLCRERAAADLLAAAAMINAHQRLRMETSAASWIQRAEILQRVEDGNARRKAETAAKRRPIGDEQDSEPLWI